MSLAIDAGVQRRIEAFVYAEARLLDERRYADWLALFDDDGVYWVPGQPGQSSPHDALSLLHERKPLLALRVERLADPGIHVQTPAARTHHHVSAVEVRSPDATGIDFEAHSALVVAEWRNDEGRWFAGRVRQIGRANV